MGLLFIGLFNFIGIKIRQFLLAYYRMKTDWVWIFVLFLLVVGGIRPLIGMFMTSQGYKCAEWVEAYFGFRRRCIRWTK